MSPPRLATGALSLAVVAAGLLAWAVATSAPPAARTVDPEYARLVGDAAAAGQRSPFPGPAEVAGRLWQHLRHPFYVRGANDQGIGVQLAWSLLRVGIGFGLAALVAVPAGFLLGLSPLLRGALDPFVQLLKPVSPLAWMPLALYTIKDSAVSAVFVIFVCSLWPMLANTAFGVGAVRREWLDVARVHQLGAVRTALVVILPAAAPTIVTGMRISIGIAWLVIVAAEMLVGGTGIGYFVWNEWNNLSLANILIAILLIGLVGMALDAALSRLGRLVTFAD